jgi:hypothetical protein
MESKKDIRKKIFAERKLHTDEQIEAMSRTITDKVTALPAFKNADRILVYADYNHEVVTEYLIKEAWKAGKEVAVPKVVGKDMVFYKLTNKHTIRIQGYEEEKQLFYKFFDLKSFLIMAFMISFGIIIRSFHLLPERFIAVFYTGLGTFHGRRFIWKKLYTGLQEESISKRKSIEKV